MKHPILLNIKEQFPHAIKKGGVPANYLYRIPFAEKKYWQTEGFRITEQDYNGKDVYFSLIEIQAKEKFSFIIRTTMSDLFWLYQLRGAIKMEQYPDNDESNGMLDGLEEDDYTLLYSPPRHYKITVEPGLHVLFLFVVNADWLSRHPIVEPTHYQKLITYLQHQSDRYNSTKVLPIHDEIRKEILHLLTMPNYGEMLMDSKIYPHIIGLVLMSRNDLNEQRKQPDNNIKKLLIHIREYCEDQISVGNLPPNKEIAEHFKKSEQYIARIHKQEYGETLENFQIKKRLEICRQLIKETSKTQTEIAYDFKFSDVRHFISQYRKHFGITPGEERLMLGRKK